jgi:hypothetical protein
MEGPAKGKQFKMNGHTLPGINQRSDATSTNVAEEGLAGSSALQQKTNPQGLYEAKKEARKTVAEKIFMEGADNEGLMKKGKKLGQAFSEIQQYTDY